MTPQITNKSVPDRNVSFLQNFDAGVFTGVLVGNLPDRATARGGQASGDVRNVKARTRSRLNHARHAAVLTVRHHKESAADFGGLMIFAAIVVR